MPIPVIDANLLSSERRRTLRAPVNPLDKSTIVSIFPREIDEVKCTIQPGRFIIPPGSLDKPSLLVVGSSSWWREVDAEQPLLEIPVSSVQVAHSVVLDYCNGLLGCDMAGRMPGLFYVPGEHTVETLLANYKGEVTKAHIKQKAWFTQLVNMADSLWARSNGNPAAIGDEMRMAATELGLKDKDWLKNHEMVDMSRCVACGSLRNPQFPVCPNCKHVDSELAKKLGFKFATQ
jgi:hypothetical protein